ncbi:MAG TPA: nucleoside recognition domain-containing protein [Tepidisphaeraceae bacterium]|nr:nucleoside recognition domain-containing protein [Tepidisphaeraceae bacterium]
MNTVRTIAELVGVFTVPLLIVFFPLYGLFKRVPVYERFVEGAKDGFTVAVRIMPYMVAIIFAVSMFRASGAMGFLQDLLRRPMAAIGVPPETLPMAIVRPLSGGGSVGVIGDLVKQYGPDSIFVKMAATMFGSTETTFYIIAVYFGAVNIRKTRHAVPVGLIADIAAIVLSCWVVRWFFGH